MKFLVPVGGLTTGVYGIITAPNHGGVVAGIKAGLPWAADVGCIDGPSFVKRIDFEETLRWLNDDMSPYIDKCLFIAGADIVGNAESTYEAYEEFNRYFISAGWPFAYVTQNGAEHLPIPDSASAVFVGGIPNGKTGIGRQGLYQLDWKDSMASVSVIKRAQAMGKHIHIGRVNWKRRYDLFNVLAGSEHFTCDGTRTRFDGSKKTITAWRGYEAQRPLITI